MMFRSSSLVLLAALAKLALALNPGDLAVSLKATQSSFSSAQDIAITAVVSNPTDKDVKVLAVNNVLDATATKSFSIKSSDGREVTFAGVRAVFDLRKDRFYVTIPAGESIEIQHTAEYYDFSNFAPDTTFTITPRTNFYQGYQDAAIEVESNSVEVTAENVDFKVPEAYKNRYAAYKEKTSGLQAFVSTPECSDTNFRNKLTDALAHARSLAGGAASNIQQEPNNARFNRYFGGSNPNDVRWRFDSIAGDQNMDRESVSVMLPCNSSLTLFSVLCARDDPDAAADCAQGGADALTYSAYSGGVMVWSAIYACDIWLNDSPTVELCDHHDVDWASYSDNVVILHELTHATFDSDDVTYGCNSSANLSSQDKFKNADNYSCLALDVYLNWNCVHGPRRK